MLRLSDVGEKARGVTTAENAEKGKKRRAAYMRKHQVACSRNGKKRDGKKYWNDGMSADECGGK